MKTTGTTDLERRFPSIPWREPLPVVVIDGSKAIACRLCIALSGLLANDVAKLPQTPEQFAQHMKEEHPV